MKTYWLITVAVTLCCGCVLWTEPYHETLRYDLLSAPPGKFTGASGVEVGTFRNLSLSGRRLLFREEDGRISEEQYLTWIQTPEALLQRYLVDYFSTRAVRGTPASAYWHITGSIFKFELNRVRKEAELAVSFEIQCYVNRTAMLTLRGSSRFTAAMSGMDGAGAAAAMSDCAFSLARTLEKRMEIGVLENKEIGK